MRDRTLRTILTTLAAATIMLLGPSALGAQRTFVASTGADTNACTISAPCRSFATALTHTDANGEIIVLDSAGYGPVFIAQSVSIIAPKGVYAGISVFATFDGVGVKGAGIDVLLRGLTINGQGGNTGITFNQGARLVIEDCEITGMGVVGIFAAATGSQVTIADTVVRRNGGHGIEVAGDLQASLVRVRTESNAGDGINVADGARASIADSVAVNNGSAGVRAQNTVAATTQLSVDRLEARGNVGGVLVNASPAGSKTIAHVTRSNLSQNSITGLQVCCSGSSGLAVASLTDSLVANAGNNGVTISAPLGAGWILDGRRQSDCRHCWARADEFR
jgi:hypothetical protein